MKKILSAIMLPTMVVSSVATLNCSAVGQSKNTTAATAVSKNQQTKTTPLATKATATVNKNQQTKTTPLATKATATIDKTQQTKTTPWLAKAKAATAAGIAAAGVVVAGALAAYKYKQAHSMVKAPINLRTKANAWKKVACIAIPVTAPVFGIVALRKWGPQCIREFPNNVLNKLRSGLKEIVKEAVTEVNEAPRAAQINNLANNASIANPAPQQSASSWKLFNWFKK